MKIYTLVGVLYLFSAAVLANEKCTLSKIDLEANSKLSFYEYDQVSILNSTARKLDERGCILEAIESIEDYIVSGPARSNREQSILTWHLAQYIALSGREREAARIAIASMRAIDSSDEVDSFDWNTYVLGTWGFLTKNQQRLDEAISKLITTKGGRNLMNAKVLRTLRGCFDQSYSTAYNNKSCLKED